MRSGAAAALAVLLLTSVTAAAQQPAPLSRDVLASADYARGRTVFAQRCSACHSVAEGGSHLLGPNLHGMFKRKVGATPGFGFSAALKNAAFDWTPTRLRDWLADPQGYLPGNAMPIPEPVPEPDRVPLLSFLMVETGAADWPRPELASAAVAAQIVRCQSASRRSGII